MRSGLFLSAVLAAAVLGGCKDEKGSSPTEPTGAPTTKPSTTQPVKSMTDAATGAMKDAKDKASDAVNSAKDKASDAVNSAKDKASDAVKNATSGAALPSTPAVPSTPALPSLGGMTPDVASKLSDIKQYIGSGNYDMANKALTALEGQKANLPATVADQLPNLRKGVDALKNLPAAK